MAALEAHEEHNHHQQDFPPQPQPPLKRARLESPAPSSTTEQPPATVAPSPAAERLHSALSKGVFQFLVLEDAAAVLNSCRLLRTDTALAASCARALPDFARALSDSPDTVFRLRSDWAAQLASVAAPAELPAQVVATAAFLKKRVQRWCFDYDPPAAQRDDDDLLCSVQPVLIPLVQVATPEPVDAAANGQTKWSRKSIKHALNSLCAGGGDAFFDDKSVAESRFATHWDSIYIDRVSGRVVCRLCDAVRDSLALYKRQVALGLRQYSLMLRHKEEKWAQAKHTPQEVEKLTEEFRAKYFPADAYIRPECAEWPEPRLLRHICEHGSFQAWQIGDTRARGIATPDALVHAVSHKYQHQCRTFYQPLKKSLHRKCHVLGRIPHATLQSLRVVPSGDAINTQEQIAAAPRVLTELVGGVESSSGIFSGVQVTFRLTC